MSSSERRPPAEEIVATTPIGGTDPREPTLTPPAVKRSAARVGSSTAEPNPSVSTPASTDQGSQQAGGMAEQAQEKAAEVAGQAKEQVGAVAGQVRQKTTEQVEGQKDRAAGGLEGLTQALRQTGQQLQQDQPSIAQYTEVAAQQVERLAGYLRQRDLRQIMDETEQLARRQPTLFLGGAFAFGLIAARFLKSSSQAGQAGAASYGSPYQTPTHRPPAATGQAVGRPAYTPATTETETRSFELSELDRPSTGATTPRVRRSAGTEAE